MYFCRSGNVLSRLLASKDTFYPSPSLLPPPPLSIPKFINSRPRRTPSKRERVCSGRRACQFQDSQRKLAGQLREFADKKKRRNGDKKLANMDWSPQTADPQPGCQDTGGGARREEGEGGRVTVAAAALAPRIIFMSRPAIGRNF